MYIVLLSYSHTKISISKYTASISRIKYANSYYDSALIKQCSLHAYQIGMQRQQSKKA